MEDISSHHATLAEASAEIERGWIPSILPSSATSISETHNLDTNIGKGTFVFGEAGTEEFREVLKPMPSDEAIRRITIPRDRMEREGYHFYTHGDFYFAIDWNRGRGEFWLVYTQR